jgi:hypothetical protein
MQIAPMLSNAASAERIIGEEDASFICGPSFGTAIYIVQMGTVPGPRAEYGIE